MLNGELVHSAVSSRGRKHDVIHKTESTLHIATPLEDDPASTVTGNMRKKMIKFGYAVFELCEQTNRRTHYSTLQHKVLNKLEAIQRWSAICRV